MQSFLLGLLLVLCSKTWAHGGGEGSPDLGRWTFSPTVCFGLAAMIIIFFRGRVKGHWRKEDSYFLSALVVLTLALISPIDALSDVLGWVHMVQHTLLMMVAAPLLVLASPGVHALFFFRGILQNRPGLRRALLFKRPLLIWFIYGFILWSWHLPFLYESALKIPLVHDLQHLSFFIGSFLFWRLLLDPFSRGNLAPGPGVLYLFVASLHAMVLGVLMALSPTLWYESYEATAPQYGFTPLEDQQIAGYIMWMPACFSYFFAALYLVFKLISYSRPISRE